MADEVTSSSLRERIRERGEGGAKRDSLGGNMDLLDDMSQQTIDYERGAGKNKKAGKEIENTRVKLSQRLLMKKAILRRAAGVDVKTYQNNYIDYM